MVFELGQLHLHACFGRTGASGENVENQLAAVEDFDVGGFLQVACLGRREVVIENDDIGLFGLDFRCKLGQFSFADVGSGDDFQAFLQKFAGNRGPGGGGEAAQLFQGVVAEP